MSGWQTILIVVGTLAYMYLTVWLARRAGRRERARSRALVADRARLCRLVNPRTQQTALISYELPPGTPADVWPPETEERLVGWPPRAWPS